MGITNKSSGLARWLLETVVAVLMLAGCGGGGSSSPGVLPSISAQPSNQTVAVGTPANFMVVASGTPALQYQWQRNGIAIPGATASSYVLNNPQLSDSASQWSVVVSNSSGTVTSATATLTVNVPAPGISLFAGHLLEQDGQGSAAIFNLAGGLTMDPEGNVYVADISTVRKISPTGYVTTLAGTAGVSESIDGLGTEASFTQLMAMTIDTAGNLYVIDGSTLREITPAGNVTTLAGTAGVYRYQDGQGTAASFIRPEGVAVDGAGNIYVTDESMIRKVTSTGNVTTLAGSLNTCANVDGQAAAAVFCDLSAIVVDHSGNLFVADDYFNVIRKVTPSGVTTTFAGTPGVTGSTDGIGPAASFVGPGAMTIDGSGNLYVNDTSSVRKITASGQVSTYLRGSQFATGGIDIDAAGNIYETNATLVSITSPSGVITTLAGVPFDGDVDGSGSAATMQPLQLLTIDANNNLYMVNNVGSYNNTGLEPSLRKIGPAGDVSTLMKSMAPVVAYGLFIDAEQNIYVNYSGYGCGQSCTPPSGILMVDPVGATTYTSNGLYDLAIDAAGKFYRTDGTSISVVNTDGTVVPLAGNSTVSGNSDGSGVAASFSNLQFGAVDTSGNLYVSDGNNNLVRKVTPAGVVTTLAGNVHVNAAVDGLGAAATFGYIRAMVVDRAGNVYVTDTNCIRQITPTGQVATVVGKIGSQRQTLGPLPGSLNYPYGLAIDSNGALYVNDGGAVFKIQLQ